MASPRTLSLILFGALLSGSLLSGSLGCAQEPYFEDGEQADFADMRESLPFTSQLPIMVLTTEEEGADYALLQERGKAERTPMRATLLPPTGVQDGFAYPEKSYRTEVRVRGATSIRNAKNSLDLKMVDKEGKSKKRSFMDIGDTSRWVLYAPYLDKTMIRNFMGFRVARELGLVASNTHYVEVFMNEEYLGVYMLTQKITKHMDCDEEEAADPGSCIPDRPSLEHEPLGGYIFSRDGEFEHEDEGFHTETSNIPITYIHPKDGSEKHRELGTYQKLQDYVNGIEETLCAEDFADPIVGYSSKLNTDAWVNYFLLRELFKDVDGFRRSMYFYVDDMGLLHPSPVWDFDSGSGAIVITLLEGWSGPGRKWALEFKFPGFFELFGIKDPERSLPWMKRLLQDPAFVAKVQARWEAMKSEIIGFAPIEEPSECGPAFEIKKLWIEMMNPVTRLTQGCWNDGATAFQEMDVAIDELPGTCPMKRNYQRWDQMGKESPNKDRRDSGTKFWDEAGAYYSKRQRQNCPETIPLGREYRNTYSEVVVDWRNWMIDRVEWMDKQMDELGDDFRYTKSECILEE